jgi:hydroxymethylpyrimidine/phosphomethylpyrimidine kinase
VPHHDPQRPPLGLLGGLDPTGGAGLLRDQWTARTIAPDLPLLPVISAWTRQGAGAPARAYPRPWSDVAADLAPLAHAAASAPVVLKIGVISGHHLGGLLELLGARPAIAVVFDPVLWASDGGPLLAPASPGDSTENSALKEQLCRLAGRAALLTPNRLEAAWLTGHAADDPRLFTALRRALGGASFLLKDGHGSGPEVTDRLAIADSAPLQLTRPRLAGPDVRGTGCALATAIAVHLARGRPLPEAVHLAITWLDQARQRPRPGPGGRLHLPDPPLPPRHA